MYAAECVLAAVTSLGNAAGRPLPAATRRVILVQDRDPSHSQALQATLASNGTEALKLPPHSLSFSTLDSGFWGTVKAKLYKTAAKEQLTWAEQCKLLVQVLRQTLHDNYIEQVMLRLQVCVSAIGYHTEQGLKRVRREQRSSH
jgi:hypothetical protein